MTAFVETIVGGFSGRWRRINGRTQMRVARSDLARIGLVLAHDTFFVTGTVTPHRRKLIALNTTASVVEVGGRLRLIDEIAGWDPQEKSQVSFLIASSLAAHFAQTRLRAPWVMPVKHLMRQASVKFNPSSGRKRPDFVAYTRRRRWHVVEAKGRAGHIIGVVDGAKVQARAIKRINGSAPATHVACVARLGGDFNMIAEDPPADDDASQIDIKDELFWSLYYGWFLEYVSSRGPAGPTKVERSKDFLVVHDPELGARVGLWMPILTWAQTGFRGFPPTLRRLLVTEAESVGHDGFLVSVDPGRAWNAESLREHLPYSRKTDS